MSADVARAAFGKRALAHLERGRPGEAFVLDDEKFQITRVLQDGKTSLVSLHNYFDEWVHAAPDAKDAVFDRIVKFAGLIDSEEGLDEVRVMLMPRIRPRRYFVVDAIQMMKEVATKLEDGTVKKAEQPFTPFADHLGIALAIDRPEHIEYVNGPDRFHVPQAELDAIAIANLRRSTTTGLQEMRPGLWLGAWGDEYAPERMLLPHLFEAIAPKLTGDPVVFVPGAERMIVVGSDDEESLMLALLLVEERVQAPRSILDFGFVRKGGTWQLFAPPTPLGAELGRRLALHLASAYGPQKEDLQAKHAAEGIDRFVASVMALGQDGEVEATLCTWAKDVDALLPRTSFVALGSIETQEMLTVPWEIVMEVAGDCLAPEPDLYPPRWRTTSFPSDGVVAQLRARADELAKASEESPVSSLRRPPPSTTAPRVVGDAPSKPSVARLVVAVAIVVIVVVGLVSALRR